jgi:hypothetical protein
MARLRGDDPDEPAAVPVRPGRMPADRDLAEAVTRPVDAGHCRERVVDRLRQRPDGDLDELVDAEGDVLGEGPVRPGDVGAPERVADPAGRLRRPHRGEGVALDEEMPGPVLQRDDRARAGGELHEVPVLDVLQVAAGGRPHQPAALLDAEDEFGQRGAGLLAAGQAQQAVRAALHLGRLGQVPGDARDHLRQLDRGGRVMDEVDQHGQVGDDQRQRHATGAGGRSASGPRR